MLEKAGQYIIFGVLIGALLLIAEGCTGYRLSLQGFELDRLTESRMAKNEGEKYENAAAYHNDIGVLFEREGKLEEALKHYRIARQIDPALLIASVNAGNVWVKLDNFQQAVSCYRFVLHRQPEHPRALNNLAWVYILMGEQLDEAVLLLNKAIAADPEHRYRYLDSLGWARYLKGETEAALEILLNALEETPEEEAQLLAETHYHAGRIYCSRGNPAQARFHFDKSLTFDPSPEREKEIRRIFGSGCYHAERENGDPLN